MTEPILENITIEDLYKIDIRAGEIKEVFEVENSDKLIEFIVDFGDFTKNILAGMKKEREDYKELVGKQALFVVNLPPRKMAGRVSEGMIFDLGYRDGLKKPMLSVPEEHVPNGTRAG